MISCVRGSNIRKCPPGCVDQGQRLDPATYVVKLKLQALTRFILEHARRQPQPFAVVTAPDAAGSPENVRARRKTSFGGGSRDWQRGDEKEAARRFSGVTSMIGRIRHPPFMAGTRPIM